MSNWRNKIVAHADVDPRELAPHALNWRKHPQAQRDALIGVIAEVGYLRSVLVDKNTNTIIDGHLRVEAAIQSGQPTIPVEYVDLTEDEVREALATIDPLAAMAEADSERLDALLREVTSADAAVMQMLADLAEESGIVPEVEPGGGGDEFDTTPEDGPTRCQPGDLWIIGGKHRLIIGDCTDPAVVERLMGGERADAVVTDSPYGIAQEGITNDEPEGLRALFDGVLRTMPLDSGTISNFQSTRLFPVWLDALRAAGQKFERMLWLYKAAQNTYPWRGWLLKSEAILVSTKGEGGWNDHHPYAHDCYYLSEVSGQLPDGIGWHASVKPMDVVMDLMQRVSVSTSLVYDPFLGSGTTLIAAHRTGRRCFGCEIEPKYGDVILRRAEAESLTVERV